MKLKVNKMSFVQIANRLQQEIFVLEIKQNNVKKNNFIKRKIYQVNK